MSATCGCCAGVHSETPRTVENRPGLSAISYRAGDHGAFKRSMLAALRRTKIGTRDDDDFSIALLDSWAMTADVLSFYQERIANESYLRTAGERLSVLELARLIGYELAPGVAATVWLAFIVDDAPGAPGRVRIDAGSRVQSVPGQDEEPQAFEVSTALDARAEWNELTVRLTKTFLPTETSFYFPGTETNISVGDGLLFLAGGVAKAVRRVTSVAPDFDNDRTRVTWQEDAGDTIDEVWPFRVQAPLFGYNAPDPTLIELSPVVTPDWDYKFANNVLNLDGAHPQIEVNSLVAVTAPGVTSIFRTADKVSQTALMAYAISGKATAVTISGAAPDDFDAAVYRTVTVFAAPESIGAAEAPDPSNTSKLQLELDRVLVNTFEKDHLVLVQGLSKTTNAIETEPALIASVSTANSHTTLHFAKALQHAYVRASVRIFGNIAVATHGESVREVLGSGDASVPFQRFRLGHKPLTYVPASWEPNGAGTTLSIFVNDIRWTEVPSLYGHGPSERIYITRRDDDGRTTVQFGDGVEGSRLPSGSSNVRAIYRKGLGLDGNVDAGKITLLLSRPLGLSEVSNPLPATGGDVAQVLADARKNAPRTVLTLDRVVSLLDYQTYASSFAGIAKASATSTLVRNEKQVFLTVAGPGGATFGAKDPTLYSLRNSLVGHGKPYLPLRILPYQPVKFTLIAFVGIADDHVPEIVLPLVRKAVEAAFSFDAREFGDAVDLSDVVKVIHSVDGVVSVDVDALDIEPHTGRRERITARLAEQDQNGKLIPAQILTLGSYQIEQVKP